MRDGQDRLPVVKWPRRRREQRGWAAESRSFVQGTCGNQSRELKAPQGRPWYQGNQQDLRFSSLGRRFKPPLVGHTLRVAMDYVEDSELFPSRAGGAMEMAHVHAGPAS